MSDVVPFFEHFQIPLRVYDEMYNITFLNTIPIPETKIITPYIVYVRMTTYTRATIILNNSNNPMQMARIPGNHSKFPRFLIKDDSKMDQPDYYMFESINTDFMSVISKAVAKAECADLQADFDDDEEVGDGEKKKGIVNINLIHRSDDLTQVLGEMIKSGYEPTVSYSAGIITHLVCAFVFHDDTVVNIKIECQRPTKEAIESTVLVDTAETYNIQKQARNDFSKEIFVNKIYLIFHI